MNVAELPSNATEVSCIRYHTAQVLANLAPPLLVMKAFLLVQLCLTLERPIGSFM
jgi:hypothetical protein